MTTSVTISFNWLGLTDCNKHKRACTGGDSENLPQTKSEFVKAGNV